MSRVFVPIPISGIEEEKEQPSLTYKLDLDTGRIVGKVDGLEAVNQFILKALLTPRFHCLVYDNQYGSEIKDTVTDESATEELIRAEIPRLVEDALLCDGRILKVYDFEFEFNEDSCNVHFTARPCFHVSLVMDVSPNCDCHGENDVPIVPNVGMFASFDPVALDQACIDAVLAQPKMPNSVIGSGEACQCEDHFKAAHPDTDWEAALIHSEKIGLGSREYELVKI